MPTRITEKVLYARQQQKFRWQKTWENEYVYEELYTNNNIKLHYRKKCITIYMALQQIIFLLLLFHVENIFQVRCNCYPHSPLAVLTNDIPNCPTAFIPPSLLLCPGNSLFGKNVFYVDVKYGPMFTWIETKLFRPSFSFSLSLFDAARIKIELHTH